MEVDYGALAVGVVLTTLSGFTTPNIGLRACCAPRSTKARAVYSQASADLLQSMCFCAFLGHLRGCHIIKDLELKDHDYCGFGGLSPQ